MSRINRGSCIDCGNAAHECECGDRIIKMKMCHPVHEKCIVAYKRGEIQRVYPITPESDDRAIEAVWQSVRAVYGGDDPSQKHYSGIRPSKDFIEVLP
jgi:hypothetical protein